MSAEASIYHGHARMVFVTGEVGELGLAYGHSPLLTSVKQGCEVNGFSKAQWRNVSGLDLSL